MSTTDERERPAEPETPTMGRVCNRCGTVCCGKARRDGSWEVHPCGHSSATHHDCGGEWIPTEPNVPTPAAPSPREGTRERALSDEDASMLATARLVVAQSETAAFNLGRFDLDPIAGRRPPAALRALAGVIGVVDRLLAAPPSEPERASIIRTLREDALATFAVLDEAGIPATLVRDGERWRVCFPVADLHRATDLAKSGRAAPADPVAGRTAQEGEALGTLREIERHARNWDDDARLLGNLTALEIGDACESAATALRELRERVRQVEDRAQILSDFARTAPGRLPSAVETALSPWRATTPKGGSPDE